jgi:hypothetical protein
VYEGSVPTYAKGQRIMLATPARGIVLTSWSAPFTGGEEAQIPANLTLVVIHDPLPTSTGVAFEPENYDASHAVFVSPREREAQGYVGYYLVITFDELARAGAKVA